MTEYWKSYAKKYCDVCKCWITDNKASVQFHESGKRHKENVAKKINDLVKKATKDNQEKKQLDDDMRKMEEAALKAYMKDVEDNPDHSAQFVKEKMEDFRQEQNLCQAETSCPPEEAKALDKEETSSNEDKGGHQDVPGISTDRIWHEAKSDEGHTYYWNVQTSESVWDAPDDYVSLEEQAKEAEKHKGIKEKSSKKKEKEGAETAKRRNEEVRAAVERERFKEIYSVHRSPESTSLPDAEEPEETPVSCGPQARVDPYGSWTRVIQEETHQVDLQLPPGYTPAPQPVVFTPVEPRVKIKEKTFDSSKLDQSDGPSSFKKRKFAHKGNARQRFDDDE